MLTYRNLPTHKNIPNGADLFNAILGTVGRIQYMAGRGYWDEEANPILIQMLQAAIDEVNSLKPEPPPPLDYDPDADPFANLPTNEEEESGEPSPPAPEEPPAGSQEDEVPQGAPAASEEPGPSEEGEEPEARPKRGKKRQA